MEHDGRIITYAIIPDWYLVLNGCERHMWILAQIFLYKRLVLEMSTVCLWPVQHISVNLPLCLQDVTLSQQVPVRLIPARMFLKDIVPLWVILELLVQCTILLVFFYLLYELMCFSLNQSRIQLIPAFAKLCVCGINSSLVRLGKHDLLEFYSMCLPLLLKGQTKTPVHVTHGRWLDRNTAWYIY